MLRDMQEERVRREIERTRTLGSGVAHEWLDMSGRVSGPARAPTCSTGGDGSSHFG